MGIAAVAYRSSATDDKKHKGLDLPGRPGPQTQPVYRRSTALLEPTGQPGARADAITRYDALGGNSAERRCPVTYASATRHT